jgi:hypothetical protein
MPIRNIIKANPCRSVDQMIEVEYVYSDLVFVGGTERGKTRQYNNRLIGTEDEMSVDLARRCCVVFVGKKVA